MDHQGSPYPTLYIKKSESGFTQCLTLCHPWTVAYQAPPSMGFSRQEDWSGVPFPFPGDLPDSGLPHCRQTLYQISERPGKPHSKINSTYLKNKHEKIKILEENTVDIIYHLGVERTFLSMSQTQN